MSEELKPCPFCGYGVSLEEGICPDPRQPREGDEEWHCTGICCPNCAAFLPRKLDSDTVVNVVELWNNRPEATRILSDTRISSKRLTELLRETQEYARKSPEHTIFEGWWLEVHEALTEASTSQARLSEAMKVLEPFAAKADTYNEVPGIIRFNDDIELWQLEDNSGMRVDLTVGQLRAARDFLATLGEEK